MELEPVLLVPFLEHNISCKTYHAKQVVPRVFISVHRICCKYLIVHDPVAWRVWTVLTKAFITCMAASQRHGSRD